MCIRDRVWGNIWLIDDIVYIDSNGNGEVIHPQDGGTNNILGLIAGGSVIIANTRPNGARGQQYGTYITINASILAMSGGFIAHYWQNTLQGYHDWNDGFSDIFSSCPQHFFIYRKKTVSTNPASIVSGAGSNAKRNLWAFSFTAFW